MNTHWWMALPSIPTELENQDYRRLRKIWGDKTRFRGRDDGRKHEFVTSTYETHLMTTLWENFSLFEPKDWLSKLSEYSGLNISHSRTTKCNWSYGFREHSTRKIADIVIGFNGLPDGKACYVIEAKRPGGKLGEKDLDPNYYLSIENIQNEAAYKALIYLVDAKEKKRVRSLIESERNKYQNCGVLTWEEIGGIQIELVKTLHLPQKIESFIAGSIQYQFCQHDIVPSSLAQNYLLNEPSVNDVWVGVSSKYDNHDPQWAELDNDVT